jgi:uncharacterized protein YdeI (YjbR/CyaY-like superfamily)
MSIALQTDKSQNLTFLTASGEITFAEAMEALESFYKNPTQNILLDFSYREDTTLILKTEALPKDFSHLSSQKEKRSARKTAIVAPDDLRFGMSRIAEAFAEMETLRWEMKAFRSIDTAINWLAAGE